MAGQGVALIIPRASARVAFGPETGNTLDRSAPGEVAEGVLQTLGPVAEDRAAQVSLLSLAGPRGHAGPCPGKKADSGCPTSSQRFGSLQKWSKLLP